MFHYFRAILGLTLLCGGMAANAALVTPDVTSKLSTKKILILDGTNTSSHPQAKAAAEAMLHRILDTLLHVPAASRTFAGTSLSQVTTANLANYDIVVFNFFFETQLMTTAQQSAIKAWLALGNKGYVGYHTSGANELNEWNWYRDSVTSMQYRLHSGSAQNGTINITTDTSVSNAPIMTGLPSTWTGVDEWYTYTPGLTWGDTSNMNKNANVRVMYYLNEKSLPTPLPDPMGTHPAAWYRQDSKQTRYFYSIFTHDPAGAGSDFFGSILLRAMEYVAGYNSGTPITSQGASMRTLHGLSFITTSRELKVEVPGHHRLTVSLPNGRQVYSVQGENRKTYTPSAFANAGLYIVKLESKSGVFSQRVMVY